MRLLAPFALLAALLATLLVTGGAPQSADIVIAIRGDVFTLDPQRMSYIKDFRMAYAVYEGLVRWDNFDFSIEPAAAETLPDVSADGLVWTFRLREDARWSNGDSVTAHDFVYAVRRGVLPDTAADYSHLFFVIEGAEDFFHWRAEQIDLDAGLAPGVAESLWAETERRFAETVGIHALDEHTLEIRLARRVAYFLDLLCFPAFYPVHPPTVEQWVSLDRDSGRIEQKHDWTRPGHLVCNGPYIVTQWRYRRDLRLERNPYYHDPERVKSDSILIVTIEDANTAVLAFDTGRVDWLTDVSTEYRADMLVTRDDTHGFPTFGTDFFSFNCRPRLSDGRVNPFADAAVRRAFVLATDRQTIVDNVTRLRERVLTTIIPPGSIPGYESPVGLDLERDRARAELASAGWIDRDRDGFVENEAGEQFPVIDLLYTTTTARYKWISLELAAQWEAALGVRITLRGEETKFYKEDLKQGKFMVARGRWYGDYGDPTTFLNLFRTGDGNNDRGYSNPEIDRLLVAADAELDPVRRMDLLEECERRLFQEEVPMLVLCQLLQVYMYNPEELRGLSRHPRLTQYLWQLEVTR